MPTQIAIGVRSFSLICLVLGAVLTAASCQTDTEPEAVDAAEETPSEAGVGVEETPSDPRSLDEVLAEWAPDEVTLCLHAEAAGVIHANRLASGVPPEEWQKVAEIEALESLPRELTAIRPYLSGSELAVQLLQRDQRFDLTNINSASWGRLESFLVGSADAHLPLTLFYGTVEDDENIGALLEKLNAHQQVKSAERVVVYPAQAAGLDDSSFMWHFDQIHARDAWSAASTARTSPHPVKVGIVDTGVRLDHQDLAGRLIDWKDVYLTNGDAYADEDADNDDLSGHGTACAGIVGAIQKNGIGISGLAVSGVAIIPVNASIGSGKAVTHYEDGVLWCVIKGADVINLSFGKIRGFTTECEREIARYAQSNGVYVCAAVGNDDKNTDKFYPAAFPEYVGVGATNIVNRRVNKTLTTQQWGSNYGAMVELCAPGYASRGNAVHIASLGSGTDRQAIKTWTGTSFSAPHVVGLAALIMQNGDLTAEEVRHIIQCTARDQVGDPSEDVHGPDRYHGHGLIDALQALRVVNGSETCAHGRAF